MKTAQLPPVRVEPAVREEIESVLHEGESLSQFVEAAAVQAARRRRVQQEFLTREALEDLRRLEDFLVEMALDHGDWDLPGRAVDAIRNEMRILETNPYTCRMAQTDPQERELVIPFGGSGYVALFHIIGDDEVAVSALRHQREDDCH